jgi:hypothetical protein
MEQFFLTREKAQATIDAARRELIKQADYMRGL